MAHQLNLTPPQRLSTLTLGFVLAGCIILGLAGAWRFGSRAAGTPAADLNGDGQVNVFDLSILLSNWAKTTPGTKGDINGDNVVNVFDLSMLLASWGPVVTPSPSPTPGVTTLVNTTFDNMPASDPISVADYRLAMGDPNVFVGTSNLTRTALVSATGHGNVLRQTLNAGEYGSGAGIVVFPHLSAAVDEASMQYDIRFDSNFDWGWGGKLPGLGGAVTGTTPGTASGCVAGNAGSWSGRGMWITPGSYGSVTGANEWIGYMYNLYKTDTCGDNVRTGKAFSRGTWHTVKQYYKMNTPGSANGIHRMWLDGNQIINNTSMRYRSNVDLHINYIFWAIFRGGSTADWAGATTGYIDIDNILITTP